MRKLVLKMSVSLDGFVAGPNGELDWMFRTAAPDSGAWVLDTLREADVHIMGSQSRLGIHPVLLGQGLPLFSTPHSPVDLKLISMTTFSTGVVGAIYKPA